MERECYVCGENDAPYRKRLIDTWQFNPNLQIVYHVVYICEKDKCYHKYLVDMNEDKILLLKIRRDLLVSKL